jgi:hypothetical protein
MLDIVIEARDVAISKSMKVRILPSLRRMVGPFIFMDHAGPIEVVRSFLHRLMYCLIRISDFQR